MFGKKDVQGNLQSVYASLNNLSSRFTVRAHEKNVIADYLSWNIALPEIEKNGKKDMPIETFPTHKKIDG